MRLTLPAAGVYDARTYGAVGSGEVDDQPSLQAMVDAVEDAGGGVAYIPQGRYRLDSPLQLGDYVTLELEPNAVLLRNINQNGSPAATLRNKNQTLNGNVGITVRGGRIEAPSDSVQSGKHVAFRGVRDLQFRDVRIGQVWGDWATNFSGSYITIDGVHIDTGDNADTEHQDGIHVTGGKFITISNCVIRSGDDCLSFSQDANALEPLEDVLVSNCAVYALGASAIKVIVNAESEETEWIHRLRIQGVSGIGGDGAGVPINMFDETESGKIVGVTLDGIRLDCSNNGGHGVQVYDLVDVVLQGVAIDSPQAKVFHVVGCTDVKLIDCLGKTPRNNNVAFDIDGNTNVEVRNCRMESALGASFKIHNSTNARLLYCQTRDPGGTSFDVSTDNTPAVVNTGNVAAIT